MSRHDFAEWFTLDDGTRAEWLASHIMGRASRCSRCPKMVAGNEPRLRVDSGRGRPTKASHGKANEYLCAECAERDYDELAPRDWFDHD